MSYKIVVDSCCDLTKELKQDKHFETVPLELQVGEEIFVDDDSFDQAVFLAKIAASPTCPKSACPSPEKYMQAYECDAENVYVVTLSANLSGSYNSAKVGVDLYEEKHGKKNIHVFDSCSASSGEYQTALFIQKMEEEGKSFEEVISLTNAFIKDISTYFILDNLESLRKNGRMSSVKALVASTLSIKPLMGATDEGVIIQKGQAIGMKKALQKLTDIILSEKKETENRILVIAHCNNRERAETMRDLLLAKAVFKDTVIIETAGVSTLYANDGGIIIVC